MLAAVIARCSVCYTEFVRGHTQLMQELIAGDESAGERIKTRLKVYPDEEEANVIEETSVKVRAREAANVLADEPPTCLLTSRQRAC